MATMAAMTGLAGDALDQVKQHAVAFSNLHPGVTAEEWVTPGDWVKAARQHARELMVIIDHELKRRSRLEFV